MKNKKWLHIITVAVILGFAVLALGSGTTQPSAQSDGGASSGSGDASSGSGSSAATSLFDAQNEPK